MATLQFSKPVKIAIVSLVLLMLSLAWCVYKIPQWLSQSLIDEVEQKTDARLTIGDIKLYWTSLRIVINAAALSDAKNNTLASFAQLDIDLDASTLLGNEFQFDAISLTKPFVRLDFDAKHHFSLEKVISNLTAGNNPSPSNDSNLPSIIVRDFTIDNGDIDLSDTSFKKPLRKKLHLEHVNIDDFRTTQQSGSNRLSITLRESAHSFIKLKGQLDWQKMGFNGHIEIKQIDIEPILAVMELPIDARIGALPLDFSADISLVFAKKMQLTLNNASLHLHHLTLQQNTSTEPFLAIPLVSLTGMQFDLQKESLLITNVLANNGKYHLTIDKNGNINLHDLLKDSETENTNKPSNFKVLIKNVDLEKHQLHIKSELSNTAQFYVIEDIQFHSENIEPLNTQLAFPVDASLLIKDTGTLKVNAKVKPEPVSAEGEIVVDITHLQAIQPVLDQFSLIDIKKGSLSSALHFQYQKQESDILLVNGSANIKDFKIRKKASKKKLLSWNDLALNNIHYDSVKHNVDIESIDINSSYGRIIIDENGVSNIQHLVLPSSDSSKPENHKPLTWHVRSIHVKDGDMGFSDLSTQPTFTSAIKDLSGSIKNVSSQANQLAIVDLHGKVDRYAPVNIEGNLSLNTEKPVLDMHVDFKNIEMTSFTSYSGIYAGYTIDKGQLSMDLHYQLNNKKIKGQNHIVINQLKFGKPVESDKIVDLPVKLAIALLSDDNGVIDMGFDVKGNVDDPRFSLNKIIYKALQATIKKTVTSPFKYLKGIFNSRQKNIQQLGFAPGSDALDNTTLEKISAVAQFMQSRKMLVLNIQGNAISEIDKPALQEQELLQILSVETQLDAGKFLPNEKPYENKELLSVFSEYFDKQRSQTYKQFEDSVIAEFKNDASKTKQEIQFIAYERAWKKIVETTGVSNDEISQLAARRAQQVKAILIEKYAIEPSMIFVLDNQMNIKPSLITHLSVDAK